MAVTKLTLGWIRRAGVWALVYLEDDALNDSDKTITADAGKALEILSIRVELTATVTAGTRILTIQKRETGGDVLLAFGSDTTRIASGTQIWNFVKNAQANLVPVTGEIMEQLPDDLFIAGSEDLRVFDSATIAAAADDMVVQVQAREYKLEHA